MQATLQTTPILEETSVSLTPQKSVAPLHSVYSVVNITKELDRLNSMGLLGDLLMDRTTGVNITWSTDQYMAQGERYAANCTIDADLILGRDRRIVQARSAKSREVQLKRTRKKGEVFTPIWVVGKMTTHLLHEAHQSARDWKQFVDFRMLEITCGEGPFLASRYDTETGQCIPLSKRVGLLDAKLREVTANTSTRTEWEEWAVRAYESTYGYEFQGDSLLIARVNMAMTFIEYYETRWGRMPGNALLRRIAKIVSWNIWQMDGLTGRIPAAAGERQISLFDTVEMTENFSRECVECRIYDWRTDRSQKWSELGK